MFCKKKISIYIKTISLGLLTWAYSLNSFSQCISHEQFWNNILNIENSTAGTEKKLEQLTRLKYQYIKCGFSKDSVYARMLHRIASLQMKANNYNEAIQNNLEAININKSGTPGACRWYVSFTYLNTGFCYAYSLINSKALIYFDSVILESKMYPQVKKYLPLIRYQRGNIFYNRGDYEKDIEETTLGLQAAKEMSDTTQIIFLLLERCQAHEKQLKIREGLNDVNTAIALLKNYADNDSYANAYRYKADLLADQKNFTEALKQFDTAINYRIKTGDLSMVSTDYNDAGYMLLYTCNQPVESKAYFIKAYNLASKINNKNTCALACNNLGQLNFNDKNYEAALDNYQKSIQLLLPHYQVKGVTENPSYKELSNLESKSFTEILLDNKSRCLLYLYKKTHHKNYLNASVATALLNDSLITDLRHEQTDEQSKLFWRNDSRDFFTNALEACTLDNNPALAFFFMEKSRAVLLNDKLNELGAAMLLPAKESALEENLRANITVQEQELSILKDSTKEYVLQLNKVLQAKEDFQQYIKSLEQKYPAYYQYKYADEVPSLKDLQNYLAKNNQTFVHYFLGDTVTYILAITSNNTKLIRLSQQDFNKEQLVQFLQFCANKELLNSSYNSFAQLSNLIYQKIFQPLQLQKGRVIICADNIVIPFDALCTDENGKKFLLNDYSFSYVYSARSLMKPFNNPAASGNFIGFAPVSFAPYLKVQDLKNAADALQASASYYKKDKLFVHQNASRKNFFDYASSYSVVSIFSHARADTTDNEPVLFMQDSVIHLSELQLLDNPATRLVLLSACQTNVGKTATGEGIYSLARGFATAGIPSVAATLWKADEQTIYSISEKFNQYLSEGMNKDEALQKAKLAFVQSNLNNGKMLPYYWANMILIGNNDAIKFTTIDHTYIWIIVAACLLILILVILILKKRAKNY